MITRTIEALLPELCQGFPIITITGPRQSGKTTLAKMAFPKHKYLDLENLITRRIANEDPAALINDPQANYILDEFQYAPSILSFLKELVDINQIEGQFVLTGSNQFSMMRDVSQSLAGRTAVLELLPFSSQEAYRKEELSLNTIIYRGFYPRLVAQQMNPGVFYDSYIQTYLQRDLRQLMNVQNIEAFGRFLSL
ncbi:MAG: AAA family ATPase, partial [Candidatus Cloacimonetes bacterium]|nr:AAA family ATPase [Candidatus Cloacimonadota bacterium]MDY0230666.1 AAA family ATPase [Candidatus Cloacimonadaceae bacterium]